MSMNTFSEIQQALKRLTPRQRQQIATWIYGHAEAVTPGVAEPAVAYARSSLQLSIDEYLKLEEESEIRHEYVDGEVFAMAGGSREHNSIMVNVLAAFHSHLRGSPCRVFSSDFKVRLKSQSKTCIYYPDLTVACGDAGIEKHWLTNPKLIIEILSPSTEATDRREKAQVYRATPTLEEYVLVAQDEPHVTIQRQTEKWASQVLTGPDAIAELRSIGLSLPLAQIYEDLF